MTNLTIDQACIIDDDRLYVSLITMLIKKEGLATDLLVFENGQLAFDYFKKAFESGFKKLPEVILLDLNMPVMDGWEFLEAMMPYTSQIERKGIAINVVSSTINPVEVKKAKSHAIVKEFLTKPVSKEEMKNAFSKK